MAISFDFTSVAIYFVGFLYWPLLYIRLRDVFSACQMTKKKLTLSLIFVAGVALVASAFYPIVATAYLPLAFALALAPVIIFGIAEKISSRRTKIKVIILAAYIHIVWQMLPQISALHVLVDLAGDTVIVALAKFNFKAKHKKRKEQKQEIQQEENLSLSELWK